MDWGVLEVEQVPKTLRPISNMGCIIGKTKIIFNFL